MYKIAQSCMELSLTLVDKDELELIAKDIDDAIIDGKMTILFNPYKYKPNTLERLYKDGYSVTEIVDYDNNDEPILISVSWSSRLKNKTSEIKLSDDCK